MQADGPARVELAVDGMNCGGCAQAVGNALRELPGVREVNVDLDAARAVVEGENLNILRLVEVVQDAGFDAREA